MSKYDMSLDDIIKRQSIREKRRSRNNNPGRQKAFGNQQQRSSFRAQSGNRDRNKSFTNAPRFRSNRPPIAAIGDARNRIIGNKRANIRDARDRLNMNMRKKDVRDKLTQNNNKQSPGKRSILQRNQGSPQRSILQRNQGSPQRNQRRQMNSLKRTLHMDGERSPPKKQLQLVGGGAGIRVTKNDVQLQHVRENDFLKPQKSSKITAEMRRRLSPAVSIPGVVQGFKVLVTNLHPNVTQEDIVELFGDVGSLTRAMLIRPGVAEVVFSMSEDALSAVETYHNRDLDGRPMVCKIVTPIPAESSGWSDDVGSSACMVYPGNSQLVSSVPYQTFSQYNNYSSVAGQLMENFPLDSPVVFVQQDSIVTEWVPVRLPQRGNLPSALTPSTAPCLPGASRGERQSRAQLNQLLTQRLVQFSQ